MSNVTKEWLQKTIAELEEERNATPGAVNEDAAMSLAAMKLALASLEAEPVAFRSKLQPPSAIGSERWDYTDHRQPDAFELENCVIERLYTAPPAPVSDSLLSELLGIAKRAAYEADECAHAEFSDNSMEHSAAIADWERRAAMLQGADGNSPAHSGCRPAQNCISPAQCGNPPAIPDGWVACSERMPEQFVEVLVCTEEGSRYVAALNQSMSWDDGDFFDDIQYVTHWMPLPAAPQQEVKP